MPITTLFIDLDDTLYPPSMGLWALIRQRIDLYIHERLALPWEQVPGLRRDLFEQYGTTMRGLQTCYQIDVDDYLAFVHDVPVEDILKPDPVLHRVLERYLQRKVIFTNADKRHARRVLCALQLNDLFDQVIDIRALDPHCKPQPEAFKIALGLAGETNPGCCLLADDQLFNIQAASLFGFQAVLVSPPRSDDGAVVRIDRLHDLAKVFPPGDQPA